MATDPTMIANGDTQNTQSPAALLEHAHDKAHKPTVEDVVDESEIQNALALKNGTPDTEINAKPGPSSSAADKKGPKQGATKAPVLDVRSEELFPALGGGPKPRAPAAVPMAWGARKTQGPSYAQTNGPSNGVSSGPSLPEAAPGLGASTGAPRIMTMPGKHVERIRFAPSQMLPRGQLKKPIPDILRDISKRSKATVDMHNGSAGSLIFEGKGSVDSVRQALKEVAQQVGSKVSSGVVFLVDFFPFMTLLRAQQLMPLVNSNLSECQFRRPHGHISLVSRVPSFKAFTSEPEPGSRSHGQRRWEL